MKTSQMTTEEKKDMISNISHMLTPLVKRYLGEDCLAIYIYGSFFSDDFDSQFSDIDFSAFLTHEIDEELFQRIQALHCELLEQCPAARALEGEYYYLNRNCPWSARQTVLIERESEPRLDRSSFDPDIAEMIRTRGFTLFGKDPQFVLPNVTHSMVVDYFHSYISETLFLLNEKKMSNLLVWHKVLNCCRALYAIINGNIPAQKRYAALWSMGRLPEYETLIQHALDIRSGKCPPTLGLYQEALQGMLRAFLDERSPTTCSEGYIKPMRTEIQMTTKCNCRCPHCGYFTINSRDQASKERISAYLAELKQTWGWIDRVLFEGGEPTTEFSRLLACLQVARELAVPNIQVNSNLVGITKSQIGELINAGCNYLEVSVDAVTKAGWCKMRGIPETSHNAHLHEQFLDTLRFACNCPELIVDFNFTPTNINKSELEQVYLTACEYGARYFSFQNLVCSSEDIRAISLPVQTLYEKLKRCTEDTARFSFPATILICCAESLDEGKLLTEYLSPFVEIFPCSFGGNYLYLNHSGELRSCCFGEGLTLGYYEAGKLPTIWNGRKRILHRCPVAKMEKATDRY